MTFIVPEWLGSLLIAYVIVDAYGKVREYASRRRAMSQLRKLIKTGKISAPSTSHDHD